jgi:predicted PurR-regulated permease PerM
VWVFNALLPGGIPVASTQFSIGIAITALLVGVIVSVVAALIPALRASRVPPVAALREGAEIPRSRISRFAPAFAGLLAVVGIVIIVLALSSDAAATQRLLTMALGALLVFLAMYIGAEPEVYRGWLLSVVPATSRAQARLILAEVSAVLRKWLVTQLIAMVVIGVVSMIVLLLLGVKAPFALAFIAGLFEFIPSVGPVLSAVPAVLMAFVDSPEKALAVLIAYWGIQFLENNLLIPYLMRGEMDLPPAITLVAQSLMTLVFGFIGLMVAVPLTAAVLVPLRMMAERENAREKAMMRHGTVREMARADVDPDIVMDVADSGPRPGGA